MRITAPFASQVSATIRAAEGNPLDDRVEAARLAIEADQVDPGVRDRDEGEQREPEPGLARAFASGVVRGERRQQAIAITA